MGELMDIYDIDRNYTGKTIERENAFLEEDQFILYVLALIENAEGKLLITQRSQEKSWAAGWWEITGGGVGAGESSREAVEREVREETGLDPEGFEPELIYSYVNSEGKGGDNYIVDIYRYRLDFALEDVDLQDSEAVDCALASWDDIVALNAGGKFLHFKRLEAALTADDAAEAAE